MSGSITDVPRIALSITEAAQAVGYSPDVIRQAIAAGDLPARYLTGKKPVIRIEDLDAWLLAAPTVSHRST